MTGAADFLRRVPPAVAWRVEEKTRGTRERVRKTTAPIRLRPNFLVIGAQKAGTTALHGYLRQHPAVFSPEWKELHYFSLKYPLGEPWYVAHFPLKATHRGAIAVGEATPAYLFDPRAPARVHAFDPGMKLVVTVRDPVERAYSHYWMEVETRDETRPFEDAIAWEEAEVWPELDRWVADPAYVSPLPLFGRSYVARGFYADQLERWLALFPREQLHALTSDELLANPASALYGVERFLGIPYWQPVSYSRDNVREYPPMSPATREHLLGIFEPHDRRLTQLLGLELPWRD